MSFHVPELCRLTTGPLATDASYGNNGAFDLESILPGWRLNLVCSDGTEIPEEPAYQWEHVSVHAYRQPRHQPRTPTWGEMCYVKRLCWDAEDVVVQYHPAESEYVNCHPHVLHLWRPKLAALPRPPALLVGPREAR